MMWSLYDKIQTMDVKLTYILSFEELYILVLPVQRMCVCILRRSTCEFFIPKEFIIRRTKVASPDFPDLVSETLSWKQNARIYLLIFSFLFPSLIYLAISVTAKSALVEGSEGSALQIVSNRFTTLLYRLLFCVLNFVI